ncbi:MAG: glycerophosphoryl diester phosphodiesterase membrane domain-containing protein [Pseudomonadota bacterium]|nr:glycerophosphoryl diester phosphodiesterase membrane domain-containing protein [Pseudomonadota bacterium]
MALSLGEAWNETAQFVKREAGLLFPLALLLIALPIAIVGAISPPQPPPGQLPPLGLWTALLPVAFLLGMIGNIAISYLALRPNTSVGEALSRGLKRLLPLVGAVLLLMLGFLLLAVVLATIVAALAGGVGGPQPGPGASAAMAILFVIMLPIMVYLAARLLLTTAVAAAEEAGPIGLIRRSWQLTGGHVWTVIGFILLMAIAVLVVMLAVGLVAGSLIVLLAGQPQPGSLSAFLMLLVSAALNTVITVYVTSMVARIYAQLARGSTSGT